MISVKTSYTVSPEFVQQNCANISEFLADFKKLNHLSFLYNVYLQQDGLTFLHVAMYDNEEVQAQVLAVPSFLKFQADRDASGTGNSHSSETLQLIGSSLGLLK